MDLVEEEDGAFSGISEDSVRVVDDLTDAFYPDGCGVLTDESSGSCFGDDLGEGGFSGARWAVKDDGGECVGVDHPAQEFVWGDEV